MVVKRAVMMDSKLAVQTVLSMAAHLVAHWVEHSVVLMDYQLAVLMADLLVVLLVEW